MKTSRYTKTQIIAILRQAESGVPLAELCREHGMSDASFYKWLVNDQSAIALVSSMQLKNLARL